MKKCNVCKVSEVKYKMKNDNHKKMNVCADCYNIAVALDYKSI